jgi:hypothetical protein
MCTVLKKSRWNIKKFIFIHVDEKLGKIHSSPLSLRYFSYERNVDNFVKKYYTRSVRRRLFKQERDLLFRLTRYIDHKPTGATTLKQENLKKDF